MRENRLYGSEGGAGVQSPRSYPYLGRGDVRVGRGWAGGYGERARGLEAPDP